jgi:hypothetical protein
VPLVDLCDLVDERREAVARSWLAVEARRPFDLTGQPPLRAALLRLTPSQHWLLVTLHHIASDGWSVDRLVEEVTRSYDALTSGRPDPVPTPALQFADYAAWLADWLGTPPAEAARQFWRSQLMPPLPALALPTDRPRPVRRSFRYGQAHRLVRPALAEALATIGRREGATLFMTLLTGLAAMLHRCTGQADLMIATLSANRQRPDVEELIGLLAGTLILRVDLSGNPTFGTLLGRVRRTVVAACAHEALPFDEVLAELELDRLGGSPPSVLLIHQDGADGPFRLGQALASPIAIPTPPDGEVMLSSFDWIVDTESGPTGLGCALRYDRDRFDASSAERALDDLVACLEELAAQPDNTIAPRGDHAVPLWLTPGGPGGAGDV